MAENWPCTPGRTIDEFDADTPVPAAEVLIDLKESARRRRAQQGLRTSPRKRLCVQNTTSDNVGTTPKHYKATKSLDFSSSRPQNSGSDSNEDDEEALPLSKRHGPVPPAAEEYVIASYGEKRQRNDHASLHAVSSKLRNLLKLPKAQRWCYYEWFYSNIDAPIFQGENDFCRCLSEMFPQLKTRQLTRIQWHQIRRLMGRPRRCSSLFFQEERQLLEMKRTKVRAIQQQVHQGVISFDFCVFSDLPDEIPAVLVVGTAVTARVHTAECKGFYMGRIEAMELEKHQYWVTFDRPGLGKHLVSDTDIRSASSPSIISISALDASQRLHLQQQEERVFLPTTPPRPVLSSTQSLMSPDSHGDPFLTSSPRGKKGVETNALSSPTLPDHIGGFPVQLLRQVTQLSKLLSHKQEVIQKLSNLNTEAEKKHARQKCLTVDFQREYASAIIQLDDMNKQLNMRLEGIKQYCVELGYGPDVGHPCLELKDCKEHASKIAESANTSLEASGSEVRDSGVLSLVSKLTSLLLMIEVLSGTGDSLELNSLTQAIEEIGSSIRPENAKCFRDNVITPLTLIQSGMNPLGTLHAFSVSRTM